MGVNRVMINNFKNLILNPDLMNLPLDDKKLQELYDKKLNLEVKRYLKKGYQIIKTTGLNKNKSIPALIKKVK